MNDAKFSSDKQNIFEFCTLLEEHAMHGFKYCPFKENPLDKAACGLTNSVQIDTTKQKEVSNTLNALEGLGFLDRIGNQFLVTQAGAAFAALDINSSEIVSLFRQACLRYGPFVGLLAQFGGHVNGVINSDALFVGFPETEEIVEVDGKKIKVSTASAVDADVRTRSCLILWAVASGFLKPHGGEPFSEVPQVLYRDMINADTRGSRKFQVNIPLYEEFYQSSHHTERPLDYSNLTKNVGSLRENGQALQREVTLKVDSIVKNRRLAICLALNDAALRRSYVSLTSLESILEGARELFVVGGNDLGASLERDVRTAYVAGIPYRVGSGNEVAPICSLELNVLIGVAPVEVIEYLRASL